MKTRVVNVHSESCDVVIHEGLFANPFTVLNPFDDTEKTVIVQKYKSYFLKKIMEDESFRKSVLKLEGKILGCKYKNPEKLIPSHGDLIVEWLETEAKLWKKIYGMRERGCIETIPGLDTIKKLILDGKAVSFFPPAFNDEHGVAIRLMIWDEKTGVMRNYYFSPEAIACYEGAVDRELERIAKLFE
jgi:hypothetical protein